MSWANDYVGLPFSWNGASRNGVSCWGLVCLVQSEVFGRNLPANAEAELRVANGAGGPEAYFELGSRLESVSQADEGDVLHLFALNGRVRSPTHCGVVVRPGIMLHAQRGSGSCLVSYLKAPIAPLVIAAYRLA